MERVMTLKEFDAAVFLYGARFDRWPEHTRAAAERLVKANAAAAALFTEMAQIEAALVSVTAAQTCAPVKIDRIVASDTSPAQALSGRVAGAIRLDLWLAGCLGCGSGATLALVLSSTNTVSLTFVLMLI